MWATISPMVPKDQAQHWAGVSTCSLEAAWGPCCAPPSSPSSAHNWSHGLKMMSPPLGPGTTASLGHPCRVGQPPKAKVVLLAQQDPLEWGRSSGSCMQPSQHNSFSSALPPPHLAEFLSQSRRELSGDGRGRENGQRATSSEPVSWPALALPAAQVG